MYNDTFILFQSSCLISLTSFAKQKAQIVSCQEAAENDGKVELDGLDGELTNSFLRFSKAIRWRRSILLCTSLQENCNKLPNLTFVDATQSEPPGACLDSYKYTRP